MPVIETCKLCKSYGKQPVLHSVDMQIEEGRLIGFLGPNGAGKTTTIRILMGLLSRTSGSASIFGKSVFSNGRQLRREIGYLPGDVHLYPNMTAQALLLFLAAARNRDCISEGQRLAEVFDLELGRTIRKFSTGMRQKLGLIQAMMHKPKLLILDEPTSALDPLVRNDVFAELKNVTNEGRTVLFSSHSLDEVETLCDEVIILREGHIVEHSQIEVLKKRAVRKVQIVFASERVNPSKVPSQLTVFEFSEKVLSGTWSGPINPFLEWLRSFQVADVIIGRPDLNDLFLSYYSAKTLTKKRHSDG